MSRMSELYCDIELMLEQGNSPFIISEYLEVPVTWVYEVAESQDEELSPFKTVNS